MEDAGIFARELAALDRHVQVGVAQGKVLSVSFPETPDDTAATDHPLVDRIAAYVDGAEDDFADVDVALTLPTDRRGVLETLRSVGYGDQVTVAALARMTPGLDDEDADHRLVRAALEDNPAPLVIGDHRVRDAMGATPDEVRQVLRRLEDL